MCWLEMLKFNANLRFLKPGFIVHISLRSRSHQSRINSLTTQKWLSANRSVPLTKVDPDREEKVIVANNHQIMQIWATTYNP